MFRQLKDLITNKYKWHCFSTNRKTVYPLADVFFKLPRVAGTVSTKIDQQTKLKGLETSVPKNVTEGGHVASACDVVIDIFSAFDSSSRCLSSVVTVPRAFVGSLGPPTPAKKIVAFCHATRLSRCGWQAPTGA
jgi:hypothetical protein